MVESLKLKTKTTQVYVDNWMLIVMVTIIKRVKRVIKVAVGHSFGSVEEKIVVLLRIRPSSRLEDHHHHHQ